MRSPVAKAEMLIKRPVADVFEAAIESTEGFTFVVSGLKAWPEHGIELKLVYDRLPDRRVTH
jgi:hypothetical protein